MGSIQNTRILRFLIILGMVVLTIFIYASYSSNNSLAPPHLRASSGLATPDGMAVAAAALRDIHGQHAVNEQQQQQSNFIASSSAHSAKLAKKSQAGSVAASSNPSVAKKQHHRAPTIDVDAGDGNGNAANGNDDNAVPDDAALERFVSNDMLEDQYGQTIENTIGNLNTTLMGTGNTAAGAAALSQKSSQQILTADQKQQQQQQQQQQIQIIDSNLNKIPDSDVLIPTSNLQKFIENADKILKNITNGPIVAPSAGASTKNESVQNERSTQAKSQQQAKVSGDENDVDNDDDNDNDDEALPPSVVMTIKRGGSPAAPAAVVTAKVNSPPPAPKKPAAAAEAQPKSAAVKTNATTPVDPSQGIQTQAIYEPGHMNEEINIERLCPNKGNDLKLLVLITSAQSHAEARLAIRQTWGHYGTRRDVSTAFVLGRSTNESLNLALTQENFIYGDLIRGHFMDSYNNLTLKTLSSLEWVDRHCSKAKYILKTDDDMFINVPKLLSFLDSHAKEKRTIFGRLAKKWKPIRNKKSKYYVSTGQFSATVFPAFTTGPAYVMTSDMVHDLYERSLQQVYLKLEDVFTTGIVAQQLGIKRVHVNEFLNRRIAFNPCNIRKTISVHMIKSNEQFDLWKKLLDQSTKCK